MSQRVSLDNLKKILIDLLLGLVLTSPLFICQIGLAQSKNCRLLDKHEYYVRTGQLTYRERKPTPNVLSSPVVIALHGLGDDKEGFSRLSNRFPKTWRLFYIDAPFNYHRGHAWYRFRCDEAPNDLKEASRALFKTIQLITHTYPQAGKPFLFGFSQGGVMTLYMFAVYAHLWQAGASLSGYWLPKETPKQLLSTKSIPMSPNTLPPLLITHGEQDRIVDIGKGLKAASLMTDASFLVAWQPFIGRHRIPVEVTETLKLHFNESVTK